MVKLSPPLKSMIAMLALCGVAIAFTLSLPTKIEPSMIVEIFKALTQTAGVLLALVGVVGVFGLKSFQENIRDMDEKIVKFTAEISPASQKKIWDFDAKLDEREKTGTELTAKILNELETLSTAPEIQATIWTAIRGMTRMEGHFYIMDLFFSLACFVAQFLLALLGLAYSNTQAWPPILDLSILALLWGCYWLYSQARTASGL